jgi:hypothetical protein
VPRAFTYFGQAALKRIGADALASLLENTPVELNGASGKAHPQCAGARSGARTSPCW